MKKISSLFELEQDLRRNNIPASEYKYYVDKFLEMKARKHRIPMHGSFELTPLCNLDCKMCYIHLSNSEYDHNTLLSVEDWKNIIMQAHKAGMIKASLTGGECLTYPGFDDIYIFLHSIGIKPTIMTNGLLLSDERIELFKKYSPNLFQITLYGSSDEAYRQVTGYSVFHVIYENIINFRDAGFRIMITLTPNSFMKNDLRALIEVARSLKIPFNINASLITPRSNTGRDLADLELDQYIELYKIRKELNNETLVPVDLAELPDENRSGSKEFGLKCGGGRSSFVIKYDGTMSPCPSLYDVSVEAKNTDFIEAWHQLNSLADHYPLPEECGNCVYHDYCLLCPAIHKNANQIGHCDPKICERTKRLIQEGLIKLRQNYER